MSTLNEEEKEIHKRNAGAREIKKETYPDNERRKATTHNN